MRITTDDTWSVWFTQHTSIQPAAAGYLLSSGTKPRLRTFHFPDGDGCSGQFGDQIGRVVFAFIQNWHNG